MKKSLSAILVIFLSMIGMKAFASKIDVGHMKNIKEVSGEGRGNDNGKGGFSKNR